MVMITTTYIKYVAIRTRNQDYDIVKQFSVLEGSFLRHSLFLREVKHSTLQGSLLKLSKYTIQQLQEVPETDKFYQALPSPSLYK